MAEKSADLIGSGLPRIEGRGIAADQSWPHLDTSATGDLSKSQLFNLADEHKSPIVSRTGSM